MRVLALSPHVDDAEFGAGCFIARLIEEGYYVNVAALSAGNPQTGSNRTEFLAAMDALGVEERELFSFRTRHFSEVRQRILDLLIDLRDEYSPDLVLCPASTNRHQDHQVVTNETLRAFSHCSVLGYELLGSDPNFAGRAYVPAKQEYLDAKLSALACYISQRERSYIQPEVVTALARMRGLQASPDQCYAECFEVLRWTMIL